MIALPLLILLLASLFKLALSDELLHNWGWSYGFMPAQYLQPTTYEETTAIVKDVDKYPSPVRALGE